MDDVAGSEVGSDRVMSKRKYRDRAGNEFDFKLAWQEEDGKWCTAVGNTWSISSSILIFNGSIGDIILSPNVKYIVK